MTIEKNIQGAWVVSDIIDGYLVTRTYFYHTKADAIRDFKSKEENLRA